MHRVIAGGLVGLASVASSLAFADPAPRDLGREVIAPSDGWASIPTVALPSGTTGGSAAGSDRVHTVRDRNELVAALAYPDATPKIIYVEGTIDGNVDAEGQPLACEDYYRSDPSTGEMYSLEKFLADYDPNGPWGRVNPSGPQERARAASAAAQQARVRIRIPANTTIVGVDDSAIVTGAWFDIRPSSTSGNAPMNVIIRNLTFQDSFDCFPVWAPNDGAAGNWNALYDAISVRNATHVWVDHNTFRDKFTRDERLPVYFGRLYQVHDGHVDVTNESDYVTVSWNRILDHDKVMLIGSSDGATVDRSKLRVTLHHNFIAGVGQRVPRVRFGQVHVYNNFYKIQRLPTYGYTWGVGRESRLYVENNFFVTDKTIGLADLIERFVGDRMTEVGTRRAGTKAGAYSDVLSAWNEANDPDIAPDAGWTPVLYGPAGAAQATDEVPTAVEQGAGPFDW
jgi:pectate lyase